MTPTQAKDLLLTVAEIQQNIRAAKGEVYAAKVQTIYLLFMVAMMAPPGVAEVITRTIHSAFESWGYPPGQDHNETDIGRDAKALASRCIVRQ